jgi:hypothetical protein
MKRVFAVCLVFMTLPGCHGQQRGGANPNTSVPILMGILDRAQVSGSLEYWGRCDSALPDLPRVRFLPKNSDSPVQALRQVFGDDANMQVFQEPSGMIRMVETDVPRDLLSVRISHVYFKVDYEQANELYDPKDALQAILLTPEVRTYLEANNLGPPFEFQNASGGRPIPSPRLPHLSGSLDNVTVAEALDYVLQTFPGLWIYENCPSKKRNRAVFFTFYQRNPAWSVLEGGTKR